MRPSLKPRLDNLGAPDAVWITQTQAAARIPGGRSLSHIEKLRKRGELTWFSGRPVMIQVASLQAYLARQAAPARVPDPPPPDPAPPDDAALKQERMAHWLSIERQLAALARSLPDPVEQGAMLARAARASSLRSEMGKIDPSAFDREALARLEESEDRRARLERARASRGSATFEPPKKKGGRFSRR